MIARKSRGRLGRYGLIVVSSVIVATVWFIPVCSFTFLNETSRHWLPIIKRESIQRNLSGGILRRARFEQEWSG